MSPEPYVKATEMVLNYNEFLLKIRLMSPQMENNRMQREQMSMKCKRIEKNMIVRRSDFLSFFGWGRDSGHGVICNYVANSNQQNKNRSSKKTKESRDLDILNGDPDE